MSSEYVASVETNSKTEKLLSATFPLPSNEAMISPFCIVKLRPVQKCSGKTAAAL